MVNMTYRIRKISIIFFSVLLALFSLAQTAICQTTRTDNLLPAEKYVLEKVAKGEVADLQQAFADSNARIIRGNFIEDILVNNKDKYHIDKMGIFINHAEIIGRINLSNAVLSNDVNIEYSTFKNPVYLMYAQIRGNIDFIENIFEGDFYFGHSVIDGHLTFDKSIFFNKIDGYAASIKQELNFSNVVVNLESNLRSIHVEEYAFLTHSHFKSRLNLDWSVFDRSLSLDQTEFDSLSDFLGMQVKEYCDFNNSHFYKNTDLGNILVGQSLLFEEVTCDQTIDLSFAHINGIASFSNSIFRKKFNIACGFIGGFLMAQSTLFFDAVECSKAIVNDRVSFDKATFYSSFDANNASFNSISFNGTKWNTLESISFEGITIQNFSSKEDDPSMCDSLFYFFSKIPYSRSPYLCLESYYSRKAANDLADNTYIEMRARERRELNGFHPFDWTSNFLSQYVIGFGRKPEMSLWYVIGLIIVGSLIFQRKKMELRESNTNSVKPPYLSFFYSLDLLLPFVEFPMVKQWQPISGEKFSLVNWRYWFYYRFHKVLGWILVTIFALSYTGIIK